jgi:hypothetical protein
VPSGSGGSGSGGVGGRLDALLSGFATMLLVVAGGMAVVGLVSSFVGGDDEPQRADVPAAAPIELRVAELGIKAKVVPIQLSPDAVLDPPSNPDVVGWWDDSARPGADTGQVVITGHTVHTGGGALDRLSEEKPGGRPIVLRTKAGVQRYAVTKRIVATPEEVAARAERLFGQDRREPSGARLVLVTCTDWNGSFYASNVIIMARQL